MMMTKSLGGDWPANRLSRETSPYLLQHARNPVDWYAWGEEAFERARERDVPIFLSIGYSTCYWCHVMERESFEDADVAALMNDGFVCVKVDREERPDVDELYMAATQAFNHGQGGWPMSVFLDPVSLRPFFAGTYFPKEEGLAGRPTFVRVLESMTSAWRERRAEVLEQSRELAEAAAERVSGAGRPVQLGVEAITEAVGGLIRIHDRRHGGFGSAPKFPQPVYVDLLLEFLPLAGDEATRSAVSSAVRTTLDRMAIGGIFDQVGGGFHRYSVDEKWLVPHFEKMLYDNGQLACVYAKAYELFGDPLHGRIARRVCGYVLREMTHEGGGFFSAQDAEVNRREGQNYLWTVEAFKNALAEGGVDPGDVEIGLRAYRLSGAASAGGRGAGNFRDPHFPEDGWTNVLELADRPDRLANAIGVGEDALLGAIDRVNTALYTARSKREQPGTDDKILAGWNGLMIAGFSEAGRVLGEVSFVEAAGRAAAFVLREMRDPADGGLLRSWRNGEAKIGGFLEDYAFVACGLTALCGAMRAMGLETLSSSGLRGDEVLSSAEDLAERALGLFGGGGGEEGELFDVRGGQVDLFVRPRTAYDGATPSGAGVLIHAMLDLAGLLGGERGSVWAERAAVCLRGVSGFVGMTPIGACNSTRALIRLMAEHRGVLDAVFAGLSAGGGDVADAGAEEADAAVEVFASADRVAVSAEEPGGVMLRLVIAEGYHVLANGPAGGGPGAGNLVPTTVAVVNGGGVKGYAQYPAGEEYAGGELLVYRGVVEIPVVLVREGELKGRPLLSVTYQACRDDACELPRTVELGVSIDVR